MLLSSVTVTTASAAPASACTGNSVIVSMPLIDYFTGQADWKNGYVQLWYNYCTGENWGRTVSELPNTTLVTSWVYNNVPSAGATGYTRVPPWTAASGQLESPSNPAGAFGQVYIANSNDFYYAESDQAGASCEQDYGKGRSCLFL
jgi:hypothetical protein